MRDPIVVEALTSETIREIAGRLVKTRTFEEFVYRESEMDALFTLADIAITTGRDNEHPLPTRDISLESLGQVRQLIFDAHDATHEDDVKGASALLERAARILDENF